MQREVVIHRWLIQSYDGDPLSVDTIKLSSEQLKHQIREGGIDVELAKPLQAEYFVLPS